MKLLVDIGNTAIKWCYWDELVPVEQIRKQGFLLNDQAAGWVDLLQTKPGHVYVASVAADSICKQICQQVQGKWQIEADILATEKRFDGFEVAYHDPSMLGVDRWLAMLALWSRLRSGFMVVSAGTAVTVDVVDKQGRHQGGVIIPGERVMRSALLENTRLSHWLRDETEQKITGETTRIFGKNTADAVFLGAAWALSGAIELLYDRWLQLCPGAACVLTGGDAQSLCRRLGVTCEVQPDLVLQGLACKNG